jgi:hypothetical protein
MIGDALHRLRMPHRARDTSLEFAMAGLDPAIHPLRESRFEE